MGPNEREVLIIQPSPDTEHEGRQPSRRRLLWLAASGLAGASLTGFAARRLASAQSDDDGHDDSDDHDDDHEDDDSGRGRGRGRGRGGRDDDRDDDRNDDRDEAQVEVDIPAGSALVEIFDDDDFTPSTVTIDAGQMVTFVNYDGDDHTATGAAFDTGIIPEQGGTASVVLDTPGSYPFACLIHPEMVGEVRVRDESGNVPVRAAASPAAADAVPVAIANLTFSPASVSVAAGGSVAWTNDDSLPHTVTALDASFDSGILDPGGAFSWTFEAPGTVAYQCTLHPQMQGEVTVTSEGPAQRVEPAATPAASPAAAGSDDAVTAASTSTVEIVDLAFEPRVVTVPVGTEVAWTNTGQVPHTVTGESFGSETLQNGQIFGHTFTEAGAFDYFCAIHPQMTGQVMVEPA